MDYKSLMFKIFLPWNRKKNHLNPETQKSFKPRGIKCKKTFLFDMLMGDKLNNSQYYPSIGIKLKSVKSMKGEAI